MIDNRFMIFMCTTYNLASPIVGHCQHCRYKNKGLDNFVFNDNSDNVRQFYKSCAQRIILLLLLSNIVEHCRSKTRGMIILYLTTIVTMFDNFINHVRNG